MQSRYSSDFGSFISQILCFSLLFQTTGIAEALPLPPERIYLPSSKLTANLSAGASAEPEANDRWSALSELLEDTWTPVSDGAEALWDPGGGRRARLPGTPPPTGCRHG